MKKTILLIVVIIALFAAAFFGYQYLSGKYAPEEPAPQSSSPAGESSPEAESSEPEIVQATDFSVQNSAGETVSLSDNFGKSIVVNFWASWCGFCKLEFPDLQEAYETYGDDVVFMMVNTGDSSLEKAQKFVDDNGYTFPIYFDNEQSAYFAYGVSAIPMTLFINADGSLSEKKSGMLSAEKITEGIENLLPKE